MLWIGKQIAQPLANRPRVPYVPKPSKPVLTGLDAPFLRLAYLHHDT